MELRLSLIRNSRSKIMCKRRFGLLLKPLSILFYLNKIDNGLSNKPKLLLLKYVSRNFGSAVSD